MFRMSKLPNARRSISKFAVEESGNVAIIGALSMVAMVGVAGAALDYSKASSAHSAYQTAIDAAALAGVSGLHDDATKIGVAEKYFDENQPNIGTIQSKSFAFQDEDLHASVTVRVPTSLLKIVNVDYIDVTINSVATAKELRVAMCVMAMSPTRKHTLELNDAVTVSGPDCNIYGNSNNVDDVVDPHTSQTYLIGKSVQAIGYGHHYLENVTPPLSYAPELIPDPYADMALPTPGSCVATGLKVTSGNATLNPGTYCNGLQISHNANVTLNPGTYIITNGTFSVSSSTVTGAGVTIALADNKTNFNLSSAVVRLSAPTSGTYKSMVMIGPRVNTTDTFTASTVDLYGVVYMPNATINWSNTGSPTLNAQWSVWIVDGFSWSGTGTINFPFKIENASVPYPDNLYVIPLAGTPRLIN